MILHVLPVGDLIEHEDTGNGCPCGPRAEPYEQDDGSYHWLMVHHSLDGRESWERRNRAGWPGE
jgi:hypothetical protein